MRKGGSRFLTHGLCRILQAMKHRPSDVFTFKRTDIWREGDWLDLWSVVHFLSGVSIGLGLFFLHFGALSATVTTFIALVAYEMWEALAKIAETPANRTMDVVVGIASFLPSFFAFAPSIPKGHFISTFMAVFLLNAGLSISGWRASQKAAVLERRLRAQYEEQRAKLARRRVARFLRRRRAH